MTFRADGVPTEAKNLFMNFKNSQNKDFKMFGGGGPVSGDPCNNQHWHGFIGIESQVTAHIVKWIKEQILRDDEVVKDITKIPTNKEPISSLRN